jgi:hypothetical protein
MHDRVSRVSVGACIFFLVFDVVWKTSIESKSQGMVEL